MKSKRKLIGVLAALAIASMSLGITASAERLNFYFQLGDRGASSWSAGNAKDDNEQTAYIYTKSGTVSSSAYLYFTLYKATSSTTANRISNSVQITSNDARYLVPYTTERGTGSISYIHANSGYYGATSGGYWYA